MSFPSPTKKYHTTTYPAISPTRPDLSTAGKVVLITGAGSGLGPHLATSFAASGTHKLALLGRTLSTLQSTATSLQETHPDIEILTLVADITDSSAITSAFNKALSTLGPIDILISNAAYLPDRSPIASTSISEWRKGYEVNVLGNLNLLQAFHTTKAKSGAVVINLSTVGAHFPPQPTMSAYRVSKTASWGLFNHYQAENPEEVRVVSFHPGLLETGMTVKTKGLFVGAAMDDLSLPADFAVWLASEEAAFLKGKLVWSNWDVNELIAMKDTIEGTSRFTMGLLGFPQ